MYPASRCTGSEGPFSSMPLVPSVFNVDLEQVFLIKLDRESGTVKVKAREDPECMITSRSALGPPFRLINTSFCLHYSNIYQCNMQQYKTTQV